MFLSTEEYRCVSFRAGANAEDHSLGWRRCTPELSWDWRSCGRDGRGEGEQQAGRLVSQRKHCMKRLGRLARRTVGVWLACVMGGGLLAMPSDGWTKEMAFVARDIENQQAVWLPSEIIIHRSTDFTEPLMFRLENPTERTHVFESPGLFESIEENGVQITRPIRITIPPEGTEQIVIDRRQMVNDATAAVGETVTYRFYCPLHRADDDLGGRIVVGQ